VNAFLMAERGELAHTAVVVRVSYRCERDAKEVDRCGPDVVGSYIVRSWALMVAFHGAWASGSRSW
jgi:hypothetical protein